MTALATTDDVAAVSRAVPDDDVAQVERLLEMVSAWVRRYTGQTFDLVEDDEITLYPDDGVLRMPALPVVTAAAVQSGESIGMTVGSRGQLFRTVSGERLAWAREPVTVTYTHGYETIPADIVMVVAEVTAERWNASSVNPTGVASSGSQDVAGYSTSVSFRSPTASPTAWSPTHQAILDSYRPPKVGSVRVSR